MPCLPFVTIPTGLDVIAPQPLCVCARVLVRVRVGVCGRVGVWVWACGSLCVCVLGWRVRGRIFRVRVCKYV